LTEAAELMRGGKEAEAVEKLTEVVGFSEMIGTLINMGGWLGDMTVCFLFLIMCSKLVSHLDILRRNPKTRVEKSTTLEISVPRLLSYMHGSRSWRNAPTWEGG